MKRSPTRLLASALLALGIGLAGPTAAQPVRDRVLQGLSFTAAGEVAVVRVGFQFPVRYLRHAPLGAGSRIQVDVEPIAVGPSDLDAVFRRESVRAPEDNPAGLVEVVYDGRDDAGPRVVLLLGRSRLFRVAQGGDHRSLEVTLLPDDADGGGRP